MLDTIRVFAVINLLVMGLSHALQPRARGGVPMVLTILGWGWTLKGVLYLRLPDVGLRSMARVDPAKPRGFVVAVVVMIAVGIVIGWSRLFAA